MRNQLFILLSAVLMLQSASAFPQIRVRREAQQDLHLSSNGDAKRTELLEYIVEELVSVAKDSVDSHKKLFESVLKYADEAELKSDALKKHLGKFSDLVSRINALPEIESEESVEKLFDLFGECSELVDKYDDIDSPTEEEKLISRLLEENGGPQIILEFLVDFLKLRSSYKKHIQEYIDELSADDKAKDAKFIDWFEKFKTVSDFDKSVDVTMEVFDFFGADDEEKKE